MIHQTAIIDKNAQISDNVEIGPYSTIGPNVIIHENVKIQSHVNITGFTTIGKDNKIYPFASIGNDPQDMKYNGEKTELVIGDKNTIREYTTINPGTLQGGGITKVGNNNLIMIGAHIAHDCIIGDKVIMANQATLGGHVHVDNFAVLGGLSAVHQFCRIGKLAMIGGMTGVLKDVTPFGLSIGNRNYLQGLNLIGLRRKKYDNKKIMGLDKAYKEIFSSKNFHENLSKINGEYKDNELVGEVIQFIEKDKKRPICSPEN